MKVIKKIILGVIIVCVLSFIALYFTFIFGTFQKNSTKPLSDEIVSECKDIITANDNGFIIKDIELYYRQGKVYANIYLDNNVSLEDSTIIIRSLKEFFKKDKINKYIAEKYISRFNIYAVIHCKDNIYYYHSPYYLSGNDNSTIENNYRLWYLTEDDGEIIKSLSID
jgi:hypothetical protein